MIKAADGLSWSTCEQVYCHISRKLLKTYQNIILEKKFGGLLLATVSFLPGTIFFADTVHILG